MERHFTHERIVPSTLDEIYDLENQVLEELKALGCFSRDDLFNVRLALDEAIINAARHGNKLDAGKTVRLRYGMGPGEFYFQVEDQGDGYDYTDLLDPREDPLVHETSGRGLFLIRQFTDELWFNETGNCVTIVYYQDRHLEGPPRFFHRWLLNGIVVYEVMESCSCNLVDRFQADSGAALSEGRTHFVVDLKECPAVEEELVRALESLAEKVRFGKGCLILSQVNEKIPGNLFPRNVELAESLRDAVRKIRLRSA